MKKIAFILALMLSVTAFSQKHYKRVQGEYENPHLGDVTIKGYELTYFGTIYIYQSETDYSALDNLVYYKMPGNEKPIAVKITDSRTKYLVFGDGEYILIPKEGEKKKKK